jgi:hypothetical protein
MRSSLYQSPFRSIHPSLSLTYPPKSPALTILTLTIGLQYTSPATPSPLLQTRSTNAGGGYRLSPTNSKKSPRTKIIGVIHVLHSKPSCRESRIGEGISRLRLSATRCQHRRQQKQNAENVVSLIRNDIPILLTRSARKSVSCMKKQQAESGVKLQASSSEMHAPGQAHPHLIKSGQRTDSHHTPWRQISQNASHHERPISPWRTAVVYITPRVTG